jgi:ubiquinone/menaquinone biosynthesis C-methylase UbiE/CelD/BcsL family acetyltransferase involved in cellulose biosynthesis
MIIKFFDNFEAIDPKAWDELAAKAPTKTIFQTYAWQRAWWRAYGQSSSPLQPEYVLCLAAGFEGDVLRVVCPLVRRAGVLCFVGDGTADRLDIIYDVERPSDLQALLGPLKAREDWRSIDLNGIPDTSITWRHLKRFSREAGLFPMSVRKTPLWGILIQGREERVRRHLHAGTLAKHASIFASKGQVRVDHQESPDPAAFPWKDFFTQHIYRWALRSAPGMFVTRAARDLCRYLVDDPGLRTHTILTSLYLNGKVNAYHLGFLYDQVFYWHIPSFDLRAKRFCPDDVLWREVVAYAYKCGCREVFFTSSDEPVVRRFGDRVGVARSVRLFRDGQGEWMARLRRWIGKIPLAADSCRLVLAFFGVLGVLIYRKRIIKQARLQTEGISSFQDFYLQRQTEGCFDLNLAKPEVEIIRRLKLELKDMTMLDIGVGHGRTSIYFAPAVKRYDAIDLVPSMVAVARADLDDLKDCQNIQQADARKMDHIPNGAYDFILFAGEGLDEASAEDRSRILQEVRRVGHEGTLFYFSSRNLQSLTLKKARGVLDFLARWKRRILMSTANENLYRSRCQESVYLFDELGGYRLPVYFGTPKEQARVLKELGFHDVRVFSTRTGLEVRDWRRWDKLTDETLYYICRV